MKKGSTTSKTVVKKKSNKIKVCPHCGHEDFKKKEGFSITGQKFVCAKCNGEFKTANLISAPMQKTAFKKTTNSYKSKSGKSKKK